ncbi:hypothetical protein BC941DRAFT_466679 [Chlamydoabsidia padenii]|nr:hypothetical protein BC941DRAFT_466679 [Chlamydoabsidia padenii]
MKPPAVLTKTKGRPPSSKRELIVTDVFNPSADGNCGFLCIAKALFGDQVRYLKVKECMLETLVEGKDFYNKDEVFPEYDKLKDVVSYQ